MAARSTGPTGGASNPAVRVVSLVSLLPLAREEPVFLPWTATEERKVRRTRAGETIATLTTLTGTIPSTTTPRSAPPCRTRRGPRDHLYRRAPRWRRRAARPCRHRAPHGGRWPRRPRPHPRALPRARGAAGAARRAARLPEA